MSARDREAALAQSYAECGRIARLGERDRWLAALFAPERLRPHLHALAAFAHETGRIGARAREPLAGEMRLAWWREALTGKRPEEAAGNPVAAALNDTIAKFALPVAAFEEALEALRFDIYDEPPATLAELEAYGRATAGAAIAMGARVLAERRETDATRASAAAGAGLALARALLDFAGAGRAGRLPRDLLQRHGATLAAAPPGRDGAELRAALAELAAAAETRFEQAEARLAAERSALAPAFAPLATARLELKLWRRAGANPYSETRPFAGAAQWRRQWALYLWMRRR